MASRAVCRWLWDKEIGRWFMPECHGGMHAWDLSGCYCDRPRNRLEDLESRIEDLERRLAAHPNGER